MVVDVDSTTETGVETATLVELQLSSPISTGSIALSESDAGVGSFAFAGALMKVFPPVMASGW